MALLPELAELEAWSPSDLRQFCLDHPDIAGPLSEQFKVTCEAGSWEELIAKAKPDITWGVFEDKPGDDVGFPDMMWIEDGSTDKPAFRLARAVHVETRGKEATLGAAGLEPCAGGPGPQEDAADQRDAAQADCRPVHACPRCGCQGQAHRRPSGKLRQAARGRSARRAGVRDRLAEGDVRWHRALGA